MSGARQTGSRGVPPRVSPARWALWTVLLAAGLTTFYVLLTPIWIGLRGAAWLAEFRSRRRRRPGDGSPA